MKYPVCRVRASGPAWCLACSLQVAQGSPVPGRFFTASAPYDAGRNNQCGNCHQPVGRKEARELLPQVLELIKDVVIAGHPSTP